MKPDDWTLLTVSALLAGGFLIRRHRQGRIHRSAQAAVQDPKLRAAAIQKLQEEIAALVAGDGIQVVRFRTFYKSPRADWRLCLMRLDLAELLILEGKPELAFEQLAAMGAHTLSDAENERRSALMRLASELQQKLR